MGKVAEIRRMPSPQPSPTGEGAGYSRFRRCRSSEKECPKHQQREFFRQPLSQDRWNKHRKRFFRRPLNPSVGCVPQGTHAVGWGCRENGECVRNAHALHEGNGLLGFAVDCRSSEKQKAACTTYFPCRTLNPNSHPVLSPRGRELERGQQATRLVLGQLGNLGKVAAIWRMPSPTGEGAGCSRFYGCWRFEKQLGSTTVDFRSSEK